MLRILAVTSAIAGLTVSTALADPQPFEFDRTHTEIRATWDHQGYSHQSLVLTAFEADMSIDLEDPSASHIDVVFALDGGLWVGADQDDFVEHLESADLFHIAEFPTARFVSTDFETVNGEQGTMRGELTMLGQTHEISLWVELRKVGETRDGRTKLGLNANTTLSRSQWGMDYAVPAVSDAIGITIEAELVSAG